MFQTKNYAYFISEKLIKSLYKENGKYFVRLKTDEVQEIDEMTYYNLGGK